MSGVGCTQASGLSICHMAKRRSTLLTPISWNVPDTAEEGLSTRDAAKIQDQMRQTRDRSYVLDSLPQSHGYHCECFQCCLRYLEVHLTLPCTQTTYSRME